MIAGLNYSLTVTISTERTKYIVFDCLHWFEIYLQDSKIIFREQNQFGT